MARVIWSLRAIEQLETLVEYIASYSPLEARRFAQKIFDRTDQLGLYPESGGLVPEDPERRYREVLQGRYRLIYRTDGKRVLIVTVYHGARLLSAEDLS
jgi:toxin ParE1/3/4